MRARHAANNAHDELTTASRGMRLLPPSLLVLAVVLLAVVHVPQHDRVSPLDEYSYIDYMDKFSQQGVVKQGEKIGDFTRNYYMCHGVELYFNEPEYGLFGPRGDLCDHPKTLDRDAEFPQEGMVSADIYTPAYFAVTWVVAEPLQWLGVDDPVMSWRLASALWLALAALLLYAGAMRFGARSSAAFASTLAMVFSSAAVWSNTYISTDATAFFAGALMLFLGAGVVAGRTHPLVLALAAAAVTALKFQNFMAVGVVSIFLVLTWMLRGPHGRDEPVVPWHRNRLLRGAALAVVASVATQVVWTAIRAALSVGPSPAQQYSEDGWNLDRLVVDMTALFPKSLETLSTVVDWSVSQFMVNTVLELLVVGAVVGAILTLSRRDPTFALAVSAFVVAILGAPALGLMVRFATGAYIPPAPRYGISLIPFYLAVLAVLLSRRPKLSGIAVVAASATFVMSLVTYS